MTLVREYQPTFVLGDGETKEFSYLFEEVSENFIKVIVKHSDDSTYTPVFSVDLDSHKVVFGESETAPLDTDVVCIYRETPDLQDTPFRTLQGYDAKALENILSKIVAMIQELKANGFSTQILQGTPWQLDLLHPDDDGASVVIDYNARILKKGLYFQIVSGNLQVSADGNSFITMPKSADITEFRRLETVLEDLTVQYRLQYKVDGVWYNAESNAEATADEALQIAQDAKDIAQDAKDIVDAFDDRLTQAEQDASDAKQDASDAKDIAQDTSDAVSAHIADTNNPHSVTAAQVGALPNTTKYGAALSLTINSTTYVVTAQLKDQDGNNLGTAQTIDLPLESVVVSGAYDSATKEVVLTLQDGSKIRFSVADLVSGLQTEITALNMLSADLVDDTSTTHKFVTTTEKSTWNGKQDAISDLATIRSNAQAGKAASDTIATYGDIVTHDVAEFATAAQGAKADSALQAGDNVSELTNDTGYITGAAITGKVNKTGDTMSGNLEFSTNAGIYLEGIGSAVSSSTSRLNLGTPSNVYSYLTGNNQGAFGIYSETSGTRKGIACYPNQNFFADAPTKTIDLGRSNNVWKTVYANSISDGTNTETTANIISGASAGATAVQPGDNVSGLTNDAGYLVMGDLTNFVTKNTAQTISGLKTFSADIILSGTTSIKNTTSGVSYTMMYRDTSGIHVGTSTQALLLAGSGTHPSFNGNNLALLSEIPTVPTTLAGLTGDVDISSATAGQHLVYDGSKWKNTASSASVSWGGITGSLSDQTDLSSALSGKVDIDLSNINATGKQTVSDLAMPDYSAGTTISSYPYTAPKDGFVFIYTNRGNDQMSNIKINGTQVGYSMSYFSNIQYFFPVFKGDIISTDYTSIAQSLFFPLKGV